MYIFFIKHFCRLKTIHFYIIDGQSLHSLLGSMHLRVVTFLQARSSAFFLPKQGRGGRFVIVSITDSSFNDLYFIGESLLTSFY